jgi:peptidoglycan/LPS O-acetylase OafA/YrhL
MMETTPPPAQTPTPGSVGAEDTSADAASTSGVVEAVGATADVGSVASEADQVGGGESGPGRSDTSAATEESGVPDHTGRVVALDGIRAVAVAAVLLYHAGIGWAQGGFLGVDVFFVLSGYLITGLLAGEYLRTGRISLRYFYFRRARRLLPALLTVVAAVCVYAVIWLPKETAGLREDAGSALTYSTNWWFIAHGQSYFAGLVRPSLLLHLWSLAVEEQFYLVWPLLLVLMLRSSSIGGRAEALWSAVVWSVILGAASAAVMAWQYSPWVDPSRVYYGTDTRAFELLIGVVLALVQLARSADARPSRTSQAVAAKLADIRDAVAGSTLALIVLAFVFLRTDSSVVYPWGLAGVCVASAVLIQSVVSGGAVASLLGARPMVWLGQRSYALYLWHWPVFDVTRPKTDVAWSSTAVFLFRIVASVALAEATFRWIEQPIRAGALGRIAGRCRGAARERRFALPASVATTSLASAAALALLVAAVTATADRYPVRDVGLLVDEGPGLGLGAQASTGTALAGSQTVPGVPAGFPTPPAKPLKVTIVGDSQGLTLVWSVTPDVSRYLDVTNGSVMGCGLFLGRITSTSGGRADLGATCSDAFKKWVDSVRLVHPDVVVIVAGAWEVYDVDVDGKTLKFGTPDWDQYYRSRLAAGVAQLRAAGASRVELALIPCWQPVAAMIPGFADERFDRARAVHVNDLMKQYGATAGPGVAVADAPAQFCTDPKVMGNTAYRVDGVHYLKPGAEIFYQSLIQQLFATKP